MSDEPNSFLGRLWYRVWGHRAEKEKKRLISFIPLFLYTFAFLYFVIYLSILNSVNRNKTGATVKNWFGGDPPHIVRLKKIQKEQIEESFKHLRKRVSGGL